MGLFYGKNVYSFHSVPSDMLFFSSNILCVSFFIPMFLLFFREGSFSFFVASLHKLFNFQRYILLCGWSIKMRRP